MRILLILLVTFNLTISYGQVTYDSTLSKKYDSVYKVMAPEFKSLVLYQEYDVGYLGGIVLCSAFIDDTLNMKDLLPRDNSIRIFDMDGNETLIEPEKMPDLFPMLIFDWLQKDTLNIEVTPWYMSKETISHKIIGDQVETTYNEYYKQDSILKADSSASKTNDLTIPATTIKFVLSDKIFSEGKTIYGEAEIITADFLYLNAFGFKNEILKHRYHFKYYFKIRIKKNRTQIGFG
jgi:hypothetical protein